MKFKELLQLEKRENLIDLCRILGISGYARLNKSGLEELLFQSMNNQQFIKEKLDLFSESGINLIDAILKTGKQPRLDDIKAGYLKKYPHQTFYANIKSFLSKGLIFSQEENEEEFIIIPDEFRIWFKQYITENNISIDTASEEQDYSSEKLLFKDFDTLIRSALVPIDILRSFLESREKPCDGTKKTLITRILYELQVPREDLMNSIFGKDELRSIAGDMGLLKGGIKQDLVNRILENLPLRYSITEYPAEQGSEEESEEGIQTIEKPTTLLKLFISDVISTSKIREILSVNGMNPSGPSRQIVRRLLEESQIPINDIFDQMFSLEELKEICIRFGLKRSGRKVDLINLILNAFQSGTLNITYPPVQGKVPSPASKATDIIQEKTKQTQKREKKPSKAKEIFDLISKDLEFVFKPNDFKNIENFNVYIRQTLDRLTKQDLLNVNVNPKKDSQEIITVDGNDILIFCAVITARESAKDSKAKESVKVSIYNFSTIGQEYKECVAFVWDREKKLNDRDIKTFQVGTKGLFWYRTQQDFPTPPEEV